MPQISIRLVAAAALLAPTLSTLADGPALQSRAGAPLNGLTPLEASLFAQGRIDYGTPFTNLTGVGPIMNKTNCKSCHINPVGGWGSISVTRFGMEEKGEFYPLEELGGSLLQALSISDACRESLPEEATVTATRVTNSSMAFGLIEALSDGSIAANEDPDDANNDGISGRVHWVLPLESSPSAPLRAGRFGWKAQVATVLSFSADATRNELGITNALIPTESAPNGDAALLASCDTVPDPEDVPNASGFTFIERVTHFQRYLAEPPQTPRSGMSGENVFNAIGCNSATSPSGRRRTRRRSRPRSATRRSARTPISSCTTWASSATACRKATPTRARCARRPCGTSAPATPCCTTAPRPVARSSRA